MKPVLESTPEDEFDEGVSEISPLEYVDYGVMEDGDLAKQYGYHVTDFSRQIARQLKGSFVIFSKSSFYNRTTGTYDGRHDKMSADGFRTYIEKVYNKYKKSANDVYLIDF